MMRRRTPVRRGSCRSNRIVETTVGKVMDANETETLAAFERRLRAVEDRLAICQIEGAYSSAYDGAKGDEWAALFTEDGIYQGRQLEGMSEQNFVQGRKALSAFCNSSPVNCIHYLNVPDIAIDGDDATGRINFTFRAFGVDGFGRVVGTEAQGYYDVAYKRTPDGWRIRRRFTVYFERSQKTAYGYEPSASPFGDSNPPLDDKTVLRDRR